MKHVAKAMMRWLLPRRLRNILRSPGKTVAWCADCLSFGIKGGSEYSLRPDWNVRTHPFVYRSAYQIHVTESEAIQELDGFISACAPGLILFDIGAHFGIFSLAAIRYGGHQARSYAFDPSPMAERYLTQSARLNACASQLTFRRVAVGSCDKEEYFVPHGIVGAGYYSISDHSAHSRKERTKTVCRSIDSLVAETNVTPTHVKIDVEGFELEVLQGGRGLLTSHAPVLFLEIHNDLLRKRSINPDEVLAALASYGYDRITSLGKAVSREEILSRPIVRTVCRKSL
jgi:FkbM family methyltransferase